VVTYSGDDRIIYWCRDQAVHPDWSLAGVVVIYTHSVTEIKMGTLQQFAAHNYLILRVPHFTHSLGLGSACPGLSMCDMDSSLMD